ncbi:hypothetical protein DN069_03400 [Streptacidiphilus pinicola]|uniref:Uncharacterized protein n=1 Tax=Streptacidiphilus pinicola TaxID=2219663 RepID=A0A2X0JH68_9ACTN|nr:hypothetical protein [Streptacidiphilus pinicola]RAG87018.1 hypothetical protein DN069_03400 [Streptacidiphilus pinicola]
MALFAAGLVAYWVVVLLQETRGPLDAPPCPPRPAPAAVCLQRVPARIEKVVGPVPRLRQTSVTTPGYTVTMSGLPGGVRYLHFTPTEYLHLAPHPPQPVTATLRQGLVIALSSGNRFGWTDGYSPRARYGRLLLSGPVVVFVLVLTLLGRGPRRRSAPAFPPLTRLALARRVSVGAVVILYLLVAWLPSWGMSLAFVLTGACALAGMVAAQQWRPTERHKASSARRAR